MSQVGEVAQEAGRSALDAASALASQATDQVERVVQRQIRGGADVVAELADAVRAAGRRLDENMPGAALMARNAARRIDDFSETVRGQSMTEMLEATAGFARRRPALVFGVTALIGFATLRLMSAASDREDDDRDTDRNTDRERGREGDRDTVRNLDQGSGQRFGQAPGQGSDQGSDQERDEDRRRDNPPAREAASPAGNRTEATPATPSEGGNAPGRKANAGKNRNKK